MKAEYRERMTPDEIFEAAGKGRELLNLEPAEDALFAGAVLGLAYLIIRPILRFLTLPIGCLTLGLSNFVIDTILLMVCDGWIEGFAIDGIGWAAAAALCVNAVVLIAGGWK